MVLLLPATELSIDTAEYSMETTGHGRVKA